MKNESDTSSRSGSAKPLAIVILVLLVIAAGAWWLSHRQSAGPGPSAGNENTNKPAAELPPLPEKYYDIAGTVKEVNQGSFTVATRLRTDVNTIADGYRDAVLTVQYDAATKFEKRAAYNGSGQVPGTSKASAKDIEVGSLVDIHSRQNIHGLDSFIAGTVTIKAQATK
jgi:hypothetical protein